MLIEGELILIANFVLEVNVGRFQPRSSRPQTLPGSGWPAQGWPGAPAYGSPYNPLTTADQSLLSAQLSAYDQLQVFLRDFKATTNGIFDQKKTDDAVTMLLAIRISMSSATINSAGATSVFFESWTDWVQTLAAVQAEAANYQN